MEADFSQIAALLSDPGRAAMIMALMDGTALPAGHLATIGHIAPQTASSHLSKLVQGKLLVAENQGRHRYYRIQNNRVAYAVEALLAIAPPSQRKPSYNAVDHEQLIHARTCYSHLAGRIAVEIADALLRDRRLTRRNSREFAVTQRGRDWFAQLGVELTAAQVRQQQFARRCRDWTERRDHIAGTLGSLMLNRFRELKWFVPLRHTRALRVTFEAKQRLNDLLR